MSEVTNENKPSQFLVGMLVVLLLVMFSSGFFIYKLVLANPTNTEKQVTQVGPIYENRGIYSEPIRLCESLY